MSELLRFLIQVIVILTVSHLVGAVLVRWGQPRVIGEILAGILLGPSFLGWLAPAIWIRIFPPTSLSLLNIVSQLGLILFMFLIGLRLETAHVQAHRGSAVWISGASIVTPFAAGMLLAFVIRGRLAPAGAGPIEFAFFIGIAMSVTAFPVLARILDETGLIRTRLGAIAIACAAVDDVTAWVLLATGIALARHRGYGTAIASTLMLLAAYAVTIVIARPVLARLASPAGRLNDIRITAAVLVGMISAATTEAIGIHALFGAFFIGIAMPKDRQFISGVSAALQPFATLLLLPIFFAYTGLRMNAPSISPRFLLDGAVIILVAVVAKGGGAMMAGRFSGMPWRDAATLGALLNTRGLVELVVLNVGLDLGILSPALFSLMVVMALITTAMAVPAVRWLQPATSAIDGTGDIGRPTRAGS